MNLVINKIAVKNTSLGGRRYFNGIINELNWPDKVLDFDPIGSKNLNRLVEIFHVGSRNSLFWTPCQRGPLFAHNHVVTILDCINVEFTYKNDWRLPIIRKLSELIMKNAIAIVAISHATKNSILRNYSIDESKIFVIPGPTQFSKANYFENVVPRRVYSEKFALMVSNSLPHKNTYLAALAFSKSSAAKMGISLRVVGSMDPRGLEACYSAGVSVDIRNNISDEQLTGWFQHAQFLISPSLDEGLNLPVAEALGVGGNVICSDIPVHREFYDGHVTFFNPKEVDSIISSIDEVLEFNTYKPEGFKKYSGIEFSDVSEKYKNLFKKISN